MFRLLAVLGFSVVSLLSFSLSAVLGSLGLYGLPFPYNVVLSVHSFVYLALLCIGNSLSRMAVSYYLRNQTCTDALYIHLQCFWWLLCVSICLNAFDGAYLIWWGRPQWASISCALGGIDVFYIACIKDIKEETVPDVHVAESEKLVVEMDRDTYSVEESI